MVLLIIGLLLWSVVHFIPGIAVETRSRVISRIGGGPYMLIFAALILGSMGLMILGWRSMTPGFFYVLPRWSFYLAAVLVLVAFVLMVSAQRQTNIKRFIRHPQLTGVIIWAFAHLLVNGDDRSWLLFGGLALWAVAEILLINRRDGVWVRPGPVAVLNDVIVLMIAIAALIIIGLLHPYLFGVSPLPV